MNWNYKIYAEKTGDATTVREIAALAPPKSIWAIGPPPGEGSPGWIIGLRFVVPDGYPKLAEVRVFPDEGPTRESVHGEWSGDPNSVPGLGLTASTVKNLSVKTMENQVRAALNNPKDPAWRSSQDLVPSDGGPFDNPSDGEPFDYWLEWFSVTQVLEVDTANTTDRHKRGRKPLSDERLAKVAYYYIEAQRQGKKVHRYIESKMRTEKGRPNAASLIKKARERHFLTETPKPGQLGGTLTPKANAVLRACGFLNEQGEHDEQHRGDQQ